MSTHKSKPTHSSPRSGPIKPGSPLHQLLEILAKRVAGRLTRKPMPREIRPR